MAEYRLKVKIGDHEFDAEGPAETVKAQFEAFKELISALPTNRIESTMGTTLALESTTPEIQTATAPNVDRIFRAEGRVISLTAPPTSETDAVMLVLYGQRYYRKNESPTGSEILDGLEQSGYRTPRIDRILRGLSDEGAVIITGSHRGKRYRLTNQGVTRAEGIARDTLARLP